MRPIDTFYADSEAPIVLLSAKKHFDQLTTDDAKLYAHYLSRASHHGSRAVMRSISPESESIFDLVLEIHKALGEPSDNEGYENALGTVFPKGSKAVRQYLEYASQFLSNLGNYKSFGDKKFIPRIEENDFDALVELTNNARARKLFDGVRGALYNTEEALLGWPESGQLSNYYPNSPSITKSEVEDVNAALAAKGIMPENTRVEKAEDGKFIVLVASAKEENSTTYYPKNPIKTADGKVIQIQFGDHHKEFVEIVHSLRSALPHVANATEKRMLEYYIESFETGSMNAHKNSQIEWVRDLKPQVESNIGFIETYRDPSGVRGEWEGLVAMVNHERTAKFSTLVENATKIILDLPWDKLYEKDKFTPPDFTSLEVLTFAGSGIPAGINIPNYDDVRLNVGFKNVSLGNVLSANPKHPKKEDLVTFIDESLLVLFKKWRDDAFEVQVGLHELLGHGTGKLLQETKPGEFNFDKSNSHIKSYYKSTETWGSLFGIVAGSFEECRAELVALYLILKVPLKVLPIFGVNDTQDQKDIMYIAAVLMCRAGLLALEFWDPSSRKWGQAHMQARFGIFKCLNKKGVCSLEYLSPDYSDLKLTFDQSKLNSDAVDALGEFLLNLHVFKCTANVDEGVSYYSRMTDVTEEYAKFRDIILRKKLPRKQLIQATTFINQQGQVEIEEYEESEAGMIRSFYAKHV